MWKSLSKFFSKNNPSSYHSPINQKEWNSVWGVNGLMHKLKQSRRKVGNVSKQIGEMHRSDIEEKKNSPKSSNTNANLILIVGENYSIELDENNMSHYDTDDNKEDSLDIHLTNFRNEVALIDSEYKIVANIWNVENNGFSRNYHNAPLNTVTDVFIDGSLNEDFKTSNSGYQVFTNYIHDISKSVCRIFASKILSNTQYGNILNTWKNQIEHTLHSPVLTKHAKNYILNLPTIKSSANVNVDIKFDELFRDDVNKQRLKFFGGTGFTLTPDIVICCRHGTMTKDSELEFELHHCVYSFNPTSLNIFSLKNDKKNTGTLMPMLGFNDFQIIKSLLDKNPNIGEEYVNDYSDINLYRINNGKHRNKCIYLPVFNKYDEDSQIITFGYDGPVNHKTIKKELKHLHGRGIVNSEELNSAFLGFKGLNISMGHQKESIALGDPNRMSADYSSWNGHSGGPVISQNNMVSFYKYNSNKKHPNIKEKGILFAPFSGIHTGRVFELDKNNSKIYKKQKDLSPDELDMKYPLPEPKPLNTALKTDSDCFILLYHKYVWPVLYNYMVNDWEISLTDLPEDFQEWFLVTSTRYQELITSVNEIIEDEFTSNKNCIHMSEATDKIIRSKENVNSSSSLKSKFCCCF